MLEIGFLVSLIVCTFSVHVVFGNVIPWYYTPLAIVLSLLMAAVGRRSIAKTDYNPKSAISMSVLPHGLNPFDITIQFPS